MADLTNRRINEQQVTLVDSTCDVVSRVVGARVSRFGNVVVINARGLAESFQSLGNAIKGVSVVSAEAAKLLAEALRAFEDRLEDAREADDDRPCVPTLRESEVRRPVTQCRRPVASCRYTSGVPP